MTSSEVFSGVQPGSWNSRTHAVIGGDGGQVPPSAVPSLEAGCAHQPGNPSATARGSVAPESSMDTWDAIGSP
jgi:hypothetical protein